MQKKVIDCLDRSKLGAIAEKQALIGVLIIDETIQTDSWLANRVRDLGCEVECVGSFAQYQERGGSRHQDIVLADANVFDPEAVDTIVNLRAFFGAKPSTCIIALTSFCPGGFDNLLKQAGCDLSVTKSRELRKALTATKAFVHAIQKRKAERLAHQ